MDLPTLLAVTKDELADNPKFTDLLKRLGKELAPSLATKESQARLEESTSRMKHQRRYYHTQAILVNALKQSSNVSKVCDAETSLLFAPIAARKQEWNDPTVKMTEPSTESIQQHVQMLHSAFCSALPPKNKEEKNSKPSGGNEIGKTVTGLVKARTKLRNQVRTYISRSEALRCQSLKSMVKSSALLQTLIHQYKHEHGLAMTKSHSDFYFHEMSRIHHWHKRVLANILNNTYTTESIPALQRVNELLSDYQQQLEFKAQQREDELAAYNQLGDEFAKIAAQYGEVQTKISEQEWMLINMMEEN